MKKNKLLSLLIAASIPLTTFGCSSETIINPKFSKESETDSLEDVSGLSEKYNPIELETIKEHISSLQNDAEISGNSEKLQDDIDVLLNDLDAASEALSYITVAYYCDWYNDELEYEYDSCYETIYVATELLTYAFSNCYKIDEYSALFEPYADIEYLDYYTDRSMSINRLEGYSKVDYSVMDEYLDDYYDIAYNNAKNDDLKNLEAAEVYLDLLASYDTETFYDAYNRDFSAEKVLELSSVVQNKLIPAGNRIEDVLQKNNDLSEIYDSIPVIDDPFETIKKYSSEISPEIAESASLLYDNSLYVIGSDDNCYDGSFTIDLPLENEALIYTYQYGDYYDFINAVHEFGHFNAALYDDTTSYLINNNIDIAEIQSQGMEMLFIPTYDDIYGDSAEIMKALKLYDTLDSVISGFIIGEFEYTVLKNLDTFTPEEVVEYFDSMMDKYNYDTNFYYISHLFEQPGYYISYGVSGLAALDIWETSRNDYDKAVDMYEQISHIKCNSDEYQFMSALQECGFNNVMDSEYISNIANSIYNYADDLS